jgi:transcriptional regulator with XRE-family HTH domain
VKSLREWRAERLWGVRDLAQAAGVSTKTVTQVEYGRQVSTFRTIRRISQALGVEPHEIAEFAEAIQRRGKDPAPTNPEPGWANVQAAGSAAVRTAEV